MSLASEETDIASTDWRASLGRTRCARGPAMPYGADCGEADLDKDADVDAVDFAALQRAWAK